jgi:hypothetical protein
MKILYLFTCPLNCHGPVAEPARKQNSNNNKNKQIRKKMKELRVSEFKHKFLKICVDL